jgi:TRAP-type C4-dicarboxylate transport system permease small subunit
MDDAQAALPRTGALAVAADWFVKLNQWVVIALMGTMALLVFINVVSRYVFNYSIIWVEELTQYQMIWIAYLGAGLALREGRHVAVDTLQDLLPARLRHFVRLAIWFAIAAFLVTLTILGFQIAAFTWNQETPVMNIPTGIPYLAIPIGAAVFLLHAILIWRDFAERRFEHWEDPAAEELH